MLRGPRHSRRARVCDRLGIAHYVFDHESSFREQVVDTFADAYLAGRTPIPCVQCNMGPKFTDLLKLARDLGADCLATGHYVRRVEGAHGAELHRGADPARDQSYFLFATTQAQLDYLRFPLGGLPKPRVREIAAELGLGVAAKPDSRISASSPTAITPDWSRSCARRRIPRAISSISAA